MPTGSVKWYSADKGHGFISQDDGGADVSSEVQGAGPGGLEENQRVEFEVTQGQKGAQAERVRPL
ncbi:cold-shock protein [Streptomyces kutzneri]|uniref:cold-shock protein n=1 Tax=Streptomyces kutzneri TaxID=3051179 RepID=UPI0028D13637|nr:cold-shock protein [Streptomyces sp. DSM 40907]